MKQREFRFFQNLDSKLVADFEFESFDQAFDFMKKVAFICSELDHHPMWSNNYNLVHIELCTHSKGGAVTDLDRTLAKKIEKLL